jgi:hypothetical protein
MTQEGNIITADAGYIFQRIIDDVYMGTAITLGIDYSTGEAREDKVEYYKEVETPLEMIEYDAQAIKNELFVYCISLNMSVKGFIGDMSEFIDNGTEYAFTAINMYLAKELKNGEITEDNISYIESIFLKYGVNLDEYKTIEAEE